VGATQGPNVNGPEIACQSQLGGVITTAGGFSTYFSAPSWQKDSISYYFNNALTASEQPTSGYNPEGRGLPDIALIGVAYQVVVGGVVTGVFGTSCSAPVMAAFVSLVNAARLAQKKSTIGWINPTLYAVGYNNTIGIKNIYNDAQFNDVTSGINNCCSSTNPLTATCCQAGFTATKGWDPLTGWGSVNYTQFAQIFDANNFIPTDQESLAILHSNINNNIAAVESGLSSSSLPSSISSVVSTVSFFLSFASVSSMINTHVAMMMMMAVFALVLVLFGVRVGVTMFNNKNQNKQ
jgi:hypothetical protein